MKVVQYVKLLRPKQWIKNSFVLAPLLFSQGSVGFADVHELAFTFLIFCVAASAVYVYNDLLDVDKDRLHPVKSKTRPLASGEVSVFEARVILIVLLGLIIISFSFRKNFANFIIAAYLVLNYFYTNYLKSLPIFDVFCIAIGFVLRVIAGNFALTSSVSEWMVVATFSLALYLATIKRRQELISTGDGARSVLGKYSVPFVDRLAEFSAVSAVIFYSMFAILHRPVFFCTIPLVVFGLFRYWYIVDFFNEGESPTDVLYKDSQIQGVILIWALLVYVLGWVV